MKLFAYTGGVYALISASKQLIIESAKVSDTFSDIEKTTGLTADQIKRLDKDLQDLDTRSSREELLKMSVVAGRMDIAGKDITEFVAVVDKAIVSLKGELDGSAEDIATDLAKMSAVYGFEEKYGVAEGINKIGSAINFLGANTKAQAQPMLEFTKRMQGISGIANINISDIIGLGASFDELGGNVEVNATSINQLLVAMGNKTQEFAKLAGVGFEEFDKILRKDANEALILFANNTGKTANDIVELTGKLNGLGLRGKKVVETIGLLAGNTEVFRKNQRIANEEIEKGTSLTQEFNIKNQNLAGNLAKIWKNITSSIITSGLIDALTKVTGLFISTSTNLEKAQGQSARSRAEFELLTSTFNSLFKKTNKTKEEVDHLETSYKKLQTLYPSYLGNLKLEKDNYDDIQGALNSINVSLLEKSKLATKKALEQDAEEKLAEKYEEAIDLIKKRQKEELKLEELEKKKYKLLGQQGSLQGSNVQKVINSISAQETKIESFNSMLRKNKEEQLKIIEVNKRVAKSYNEFFDIKIDDSDGVGAIFPSKEEYEAEMKKIEDASKNNPIEVSAELKFGDNPLADATELRDLEFEGLKLIDIASLDKANEKIPQMIAGITELTEAQKETLKVQEAIANVPTTGFKAFISAGLQGTNALEAGFKAIKNAFIDLVATMASKAIFFQLMNMLTGGTFGIGKSFLNMLGFAKGGKIPEPERFAEGGGLSPNRRNILINDANDSQYQEYIVNGKRTKQYQPVLDTINFGTNSQIDNMLNGGSAIGKVNNTGTALASGGIVPRSTGTNNSEIMRALNNINRTIEASGNGNIQGLEALYNKPAIDVKGVSEIGVYQFSEKGKKASNQLTGSK